MKVSVKIFGLAVIRSIRIFGLAVSCLVMTLGLSLMTSVLPSLCSLVEDSFQLLIVWWEWPAT